MRLKNMLLDFRNIIPKLINDLETKPAKPTLKQLGETITDILNTKEGIKLNSNELMLFNVLDNLQSEDSYQNIFITTCKLNEYLEWEEKSIYKFNAPF